MDYIWRSGSPVDLEWPCMSVMNARCLDHLILESSLLKNASLLWLLLETSSIGSLGRKNRLPEKLQACTHKQALSMTLDGFYKDLSIDPILTFSATLNVVVTLCRQWKCCSNCSLLVQTKRNENLQGFSCRLTVNKVDSKQHECTITHLNHIFFKTSKITA